ncbi:NTPase KAP family P-loop domain-containing protein 1 [Syngnathus typhle]|uniref:NTPase KAP family P-loop domain-containing protein 1 n=1 Tax=Syngnathus typhle TaxID=161592 RepID=UPI002A69BE80|nr:NTPase KAP family P-loop domain-containing protein 1 [Syngnathus typhle]XP_061132310.1 NTPase KAP family P-loop domain-containing protein 1 [Syngnathus typhle]XP_061132311.1 NTPase KAP family P-loop domain-containing protein 1 [Syngnathus typhle]
MSPPTKDDIFAYALSKTLTKVSSPATVGLYSSCQSRIGRILGKMEVYLSREALKIEENYKGKFQPRTIQPSLSGLLALVWRLLFYKPIWTKENLDHQNVRFIFVNFSAWHFAGSDLLWAGLAIRLFQAMQINFGKLQLVLYRAAQHDVDDEIKKKIVVAGPNHWRSKKICCCPLWFLLLLTLLVPLIILVFLLTFELPNHMGKPAAKVNGTTTSHGSVLKGLALASFGVPAAKALRFSFRILKNLIFNQERKIKRGMDNKRVSSKLGFMDQVRKEMWLLSRFVEFMEVFERRRIRVVLKIVNLDRCSPPKIVAVLDAIDILLSDEDSPFISILAVDPDIIVEKVNYADGCFCKEDRAYALLRRIVTLAFTVPPLCDDSKLTLFHSLAGGSKTLKDGSIIEDKHQTGSFERNSLSNSSSVVILETNEAMPLIDKTVQPDITEAEVEGWVKRILKSTETKLNEYILDDSMSMRRVINSIRVTVIIMKASKTELPQPDLIAAWVVLANQWPCRLSWIIQCVEDARQRDDIDQNEVDDSKSLWEVFTESRAELYVMRSQIEDLLDQDGDPEMFERFLKLDFRFTIKDLKALNRVTVNLNPSIKSELAMIRGTSRLKDTGWIRTSAPLPITSLINMDSEDICKELEKMEYPQKYAEIIKSNHITGSSLVFGDPDDIKKLLDMTFGEWTTFRLRFLGFPLHLQAQNKNVQHPPSHLSRLHLHDSHHSLSNPH